MSATRSSSDEVWASETINPSGQNGRRPWRPEPGGPSCDVCPYDPDPILCSSSVVARPALSDDMVAVSGEWQGVVRGANDGCALGGQALHEAREGRVVADCNAKRETVHSEHWRL